MTTKAAMERERAYHAAERVRATLQVASQAIDAADALALLMALGLDDPDELRAVRDGLRSMRGEPTPA